jgi:hypothetical protein
VPRIERGLSREGCVSVGGNYYSVPDGTRARVVDGESTPTQVRILENGPVIAVHLLLQGRRQRSVLPGHRRPRPVKPVDSPVADIRLPILTGQQVHPRSMSVYAQIGVALGAQS